MAMNILYYSWNENSAEDVEQTFQLLDYNYTKISYPFSDYEADAEFEQKVKETLEVTKSEVVFSFNYFPLLSKVCMEKELSYISWVYDCPHLTLYSKTIINECNYLFLFDRKMKRMVENMGAKHIFHMPLAVNTRRLNKQLDLGRKRKSECFLHEISFVGSLYEKNMYDQILYLPEYLKGYLEAGIVVQQKIYGYHVFEDLLDRNIVEYVSQYLKIEEDSNYFYTFKDILMNILDQKTTSEERIHLLNRASEYFALKVFTDSNSELLPEGVAGGTVGYTDGMPGVFHDSKINLNISLRSILSGIPLRCLDIMGAGGFLLSNFQPELEEFFVPGKEFVYFVSEEDMLEKIEFYLSHEKERVNIAENGWKKIQNEFSYEKRLKEIFDKVFG